MHQLLRISRWLGENPYLQFAGAFSLVTCAVFEVTESAFEHWVDQITGISWGAPQGLILYGLVIGLRFFSEMVEGIERIERGRRRRARVARRQMHPSVADRKRVPPVVEAERTERAG
ncbi:MAG: hypothetical protein NTZ05_03855 [Chloroflexi bacterium]|nr:hypothetical protein [Chloroflexota bacterium]